MASKKSTPAFQVAATLPGEYEFISAVAADLCDDAPKLVYADWLEEQGDKRAAFVRQLVAAGSLKKGKLPDASPYPLAWTNMLGVPLLQGILEAELVGARELVLKLARPMVTIATKKVKESAISVGDSKFGGLPDLPKGIEWPKCDQGPLAFLGQIALRDLQGTQAAHVLPKDGVLSFFAYDNDGAQPGNFQPEEGVTQVFYTADAKQLIRREPPKDFDETGYEILPTCRLSFCESWDLPEYGDKYPSTNAKDMKKLAKADPDHQLGEIRWKCRPDGHYCNHLLGYSCHFRTDDPSPGADWSPLLCLGSDDNLNWNWCDGEHLAIFVHEQDLRKGKFTRIYGYAS
jgi:uncharacterized protein (TIGR02996 family)